MKDIIVPVYYRDKHSLPFHGKESVLGRRRRILARKEGEARNHVYPGRMSVLIRF